MDIWVCHYPKCLSLIFLRPLPRLQDKCNSDSRTTGHQLCPSSRNYQVIVNGEKQCQSRGNSSFTQFNQNGTHHSVVSGIFLPQTKRLVDMDCISYKWLFSCDLIKGLPMADNQQVFFKQRLVLAKRSTWILAAQEPTQTFESASSIIRLEDL